MRPATRAGPRRARARGDVAGRTVAVDVSLPHLDRAFDYLVTEAQSSCGAAGRPGAGAVRRAARRRVRARAARRRPTTTGGCPTSSGCSARSRCSPTEIAALCRRSRTAGPARWPTWCGSRCRRGMPPPRSWRGRGRRRPLAAPPAAALERYAGGAGCSPSCASGAPRRSWTVLPGDWPAEIAAAVAATVGVGPRRRRRRRRTRATSTGWMPRSTAALGAGRHVALTADLGPAERYRRFLAVEPRRRRGRRRHPGRGLGAGRRPRAARGLGRRRRPARRAAGAVPPCPRRRGAARAPSRRRRCCSPATP